MRVCMCVFRASAGWADGQILLRGYYKISTLFYVFSCIDHCGPCEPGVNLTQRTGSHL